MPRLQNPKRPRKSGSSIFGAPHSPFQTTIFKAMKERGLTFEDVASEMQINKGTFWGWIHTSNGYPSTKSCKKHHLETISRLLKIPMPELQALLDESRRLYTASGAIPMPESVDALGDFIRVLETDKRKNVSLSYVLNLAKRFHASAIAAGARTAST